MPIVLLSADILVNLIDRQLEIYTQPTDAGTYAVEQVLSESATLEHPELGSLTLGYLLP